jgi:ribosomal protein S18 acetylase RimI-like enzyme
MIELEAPLRPATPDDASALAELVNMAGDGLPLHLWAQMAASGESPWDVGSARARRETGAFSYRNAVVREEDGQVTACLIGYPLPDRPDPAAYEGMPAMFVPLQELEDLACGSWYVNVLAAYPRYRGRGYGRQLLAVAERLALHAGRPRVSIIVADVNAGARRLYEHLGYRERARRPMVKAGWQGSGEHWVLLLKTL